jgi:hypothetical protein
MTDYRDLTEEQQYEIDVQMLSHGEDHDVIRWVKEGDMCALCFMAAHVCLCSHDDDDE